MSYDTDRCRSSIRSTQTLGNLRSTYLNTLLTFCLLHNAASKADMHCGTPSLCYIRCRLFVHLGHFSKDISISISSWHWAHRIPTNNSTFSCKCAQHRVLERLFLSKCVKIQLCHPHRPADQLCTCIISQGREGRWCAVCQTQPKYLT